MRKDPERHQPWLLAVVDLWPLRLTWTAVCIICTVGASNFGSVALSFTGIAAALSAAVTLPLVRGVGLRWLRFLAGATTATAGALLTLQLSAMVGRPDLTTDDGMSASLVFSLVLAAVGGWIADHRLTREAQREQAVRDLLATERHDALMEAVVGRAMRPSFRARDVPWAVAAIVMSLTRR